LASDSFFGSSFFVCSFFGSSFLGVSFLPSSPKISIILLAFLGSSFLTPFDGLNNESAASDANSELSLDPNTSATGLL